MSGLRIAAALVAVWTAHEALRFRVKMPKGCPMTTQERAYTSPIWYKPAK